MLEGSTLSAISTEASTCMYCGATSAGAPPASGSGVEGEAGRAAAIPNVYGCPARELGRQARQRKEPGQRAVFQKLGAGHCASYGCSICNCVDCGVAPLCSPASRISSSCCSIASGALAAPGSRLVAAAQSGLLVRGVGNAATCLGAPQCTHRWRQRCGCGQHLCPQGAATPHCRLALVRCTAPGTSVRSVNGVQWTRRSPSPCSSGSKGLPTEWSPAASQGGQRCVGLHCRG